MVPHMCGGLAAAAVITAAFLAGATWALSPVRPAEERPRARLDTVSPRQQLGHWPATGAHGDLPQFTLPAIEHRRRMRPLVRVDPDHHVHTWVLLSNGGNRGKHP